jgi:hypothetical protein
MSGAPARCDAGTPNIPCLHRTADGIFRGTYVGIVWGVYFAGEHLQETAAANSGKPLGFGRSALKAGRFVGAQVVGFSIFLGGFNALQCTLGQLFGEDNGITATATGGMLGMLAGCILPTRPTGYGIALGAGATAFASYWVTRGLLPPPSRTRAEGALPAASAWRSAERSR